MAWTIFRKAPTGQDRLSDDSGRMKIHRPARRMNLIGQILALTAAMIPLTLGCVMILGQVSSDYGFVVLALTGLGGLFICEMIGRRGWERKIADQIHNNMDSHNRLVREVARNRGDIAALKDGLEETAAALEDHAKRWPVTAAGIETRILNVIADRLGSLGSKARLRRNGSDSREIIELQLAPPPRRDPPESRSEQAMRARTNYTDQSIASLLRRAVQQDQMAMFVQPVVSLPQRRVKMIESLGRIRTGSGNWLYAERYMKTAANDALLPVIDDLLLLQCLNALDDPRGGIPPDAPFILNIDGSTLSNKGFMTDLTACLARNRPMASRLVFELPQAALDSLPPAVAPILQALARLGCRFSMDSVRKRRIDVTRLKDLHVRFIKLDAAWLIREIALDDGAAHVTRLKRQLDAAGIDLIVERIENESDVRELLDFGISLGQGYLFGKPELYEIWREKQNKAKKAGKAA